MAHFTKFYPFNDIHYIPQTCHV